MDLPLDEALVPTPTWTFDPHHESHHLSVDHHLRDEKGRAVGGQAVIHHLPPDFYSVLTEGGTKTFRVVVTPTRDHQTFGSGRSFSFHATLASAKAQAARDLQKQAQSYVKKYGSR
jgi:hypothetical protein